MIEAELVSKHFGEIEALHDVSVKVGKGSIYGLVGSNGAGKTTLLKILTGIYRQDSGEVRVAAEPVFENNGIKNRMLFISDSPYFFSNFTIEDMANFYRRVYPGWEQERYTRLGAVFDIDTKRRIRTLSRGMQRQASFWLGLSLAPDVMVLDEPLDGLDPVMRQKVKNLIFQSVAEKEMTVLISSHNLRELEGVCDFVGILHQGKMLIQKDLDDLKAGLHKIQVAFTGGIPENLLQGVQTLHQENRGSVLILIVRGPYDETVRRIEAHRPAILDVLPLTLEEIFIYEMGDYGYEIKNVLF